MKVQLILRARKLPAKSFVFRKPNSFAVVSEISGVGSVLGIRRLNIGRTETIPNAQSPSWAAIFILQHEPGTSHRIGVDIFQSNKPEDQENFNSQYFVDNYQGTKTGQSTYHHVSPQDQATHICGCFFDIEEILRSPNHELQEKMQGTNSETSIFAHVEISVVPRMVSSYCNDTDSTDQKLFFQLRGLDLHNVRLTFVDRPDFYFEIERKYKGRAEHSWHLVFRSERTKGTLNPMWDAATVEVEKLCNYDMHRDIRITIWDFHEKLGVRTLLGEVNTNIDALIKAISVKGNSDKEKALVVRKKQKNKGFLVVLDASVITLDHSSGRYRKTPSMTATSAPAAAASVQSGSGGSSGVAGLSPHRSGSTNASPYAAATVLGGSSAASAVPTTRSIHTDIDRNIPMAVAVAEPISYREQAVEPPATFDDYIAAKSELELCVAIDFTKRNGDYRTPGTAHHVSGDADNDYEWVLGVIGRIVGHFNARKDYPMWGFGAEFKRKTHHIFQCGTSSKAHDVPGLMQAYRHIFSTNPVLGDEVKFDAVIHQAASHATKALNAAQANGRLAYTVLLILTAGTESDIKAASQKLEAVSVAPMSIVFVKMTPESIWDEVKLDMLLTKNGMIRSFCTFCSCQTFCKQNMRNSQDLGRLCFDQVTEQMVSYFKSRGMYPGSIR